VEWLDRRWSRWQAESHRWTRFAIALGAFWACAWLYEILALGTPLLKFRTAWPPVLAAVLLGMGICRVEAANHPRLAKAIFTCCLITSAAFLVLVVSVWLVRLLASYD
jgi:hypothetical protein